MKIFKLVRTIDGWDEILESIGIHVKYIFDHRSSISIFPLPG